MTTMTTDPQKKPVDEAKLTTYPLLKLRQSQLKAVEREAEDRLAEMEAAHRKANAEFKVTRSNQVRNLNKVKNDALAQVSAEATAIIDKAQAAAHRIVDAATVLANQKVSDEREARSAEFGMKSMELAKVYERDHGALTAKQEAERVLLVRAGEKAKAALATQIADLELAWVEEKAKAETLAAEKAAASKPAQSEAAT